MPCTCITEGKEAASEAIPPTSNTQSFTFTVCLECTGTKFMILILSYPGQERWLPADTPSHPPSSLLELFQPLYILSCPLRIPLPDSENSSCALQTSCTIIRKIRNSYRLFSEDAFYFLLLTSGSAWGCCFPCTPSRRWLLASSAASSYS